MWCHVLLLIDYILYLRTTQLIFRKCNIAAWFCTSCRMTAAEAGGVGCAESEAWLGLPRGPRTLRGRWRGAAGPHCRRPGQAPLSAGAAAAALRQDGSIINKPRTAPRRMISAPPSFVILNFRGIIKLLVMCFFFSSSFTPMAYEQLLFFFFFFLCVRHALIFGFFFLWQDA